MKKVIALLLLLIGLLQYRLWFGDGNVLEFHRLNDRIVELRQEGAKRRERNAALEAEVMDLKQGLDAVEERARQDLGMIKEGEVFVQVIEPHTEPDALPAPPAGNAPTAPGKPEGIQEKPKPSKEANVSPKPKFQAASRPDKPKAAETKTANSGLAKPSKPKPPPKPVREKPAAEEPAQPVAPVDEPDQ